MSLALLSLSTRTVYLVLSGFAEKSRLNPWMAQYMRNETELTEAGEQYVEAYAAHYTTKDLHKAIDLYKGIMAAYPNTKEAEYSRTQIQNIVQSVVPNQRLLDAQVELALTCLRSQS